MPTIMCAQRLWTMIGGTGRLPSRVPSAPRQNRLGDWSAQDVETDAGQLVVALEETTYLTLVFPLAPLPQFIDLFAQALSVALVDLGIDQRIAGMEASELAASGTFARNNNRSLQGSVTDVTFHAGWRLEGARRWDREAIRQAQRELNEMPHVKRKPSFPADAVRLLFAPESSRH